MPEPSAAPGPFGRILACVALSPHLGVLVREAAWLAQLCGADLAFVHAGDDERAAEAVRRELPPGSRFAASEVFTRAGGAERVILAEAKRWGADLLFAGAVAANPRFIGAMGSVARRLARHADRSLYLSLHREAAEPGLRTIVVAAEFDDESAAAARAAVELAHRAGASAVHFVHEYDPRARGALESVLRGTEQARYEQLVAGTQRFQLANMVEGLDLRDLTPRVVCLEGKEMTATTAYARDAGADLLVMAAPHHRIGLLDRFFGDPTETVLQRFPCSVLLWRGPGATGTPRDR